MAVLALLAFGCTPGDLRAGGGSPTGAAELGRPVAPDGGDAGPLSSGSARPAPGGRPVGADQGLAADTAPALAPPPAPAPDWIGVTHGTIKLRPGATLPTGRVARLDAARNEFEAWQLAVRGGAAGRRITAVRPSALTGPGGAVIPADAWVVYQVGLFEVPSASNLEGAAGPWPDPLIPDVDPYFHERRKAFPLAIAPNTLRSVWVELLVPTEAAPGAYRGDAEVVVDGVTYAVPMEVRVRSFTLPSTATLTTAYGLGWNHACLAHHGSYEACGADAGVERYHVRYAAFALDHRVSLEQTVYAGPPGDDWSHFDTVYGPLMDGTATTRLPGARLTSLRTVAGTAEQLRRWRAHFEQRGWMPRLFQYTCDEPPHGCPFADIPPRAALARAEGMNTLVTTDLETARAQGIDDDVTILVPILQSVLPRDGASTRADYDAWLAAAAGRQLWWYQSCISHGCGQGCQTTQSVEHTGWPSYVIDASAVQARAMEWLSFRHHISGELYFQTTHALSTAWVDQCAFSGSGDGTLLYPGTPARVGGQTDIPIASMRLKLIREGLEDYEYLHLLAQRGARAFADAQVDALFPPGRPITEASGEAVLEARRRIADRLEAP